MHLRIQNNKGPESFRDTTRFLRPYFFSGSVKTEYKIEGNKGEECFYVREAEAGKVRGFYAVSTLPN